jgi:hypothetical protein
MIETKKSAPDLGGCGCRDLIQTIRGSTFQVYESSGWSQDLTVEAAGRGVVSHVGSVALRAHQARARWYHHRTRLGREVAAT